MDEQVRLQHWLDTKLGKHHPVAAIAVVKARGQTIATRGVTTDADFEIGSISKGFTGLLYVDALQRGEITPDSTLGDLLPLGDVPAARLTLASLSTHHSGLPRLPKSMQPYRRSIELLRHGTNPFRENLPELIEHARTVEVGKPKPAYSNLGFELLGHALASAAGTTYAGLLSARILVPLGLGSTYVPMTPADLRPTAVIGTSRYGKRRDPWPGEAVAPAGGIRSSITDMARFTAALLDGSAPGVAALEPVAKFQGRARIGAAWLTIEARHPGIRREVTFHNGGTGGFRSFLGLDRAAQAGVVVLTATSRSVDQAGFLLLTDPSTRT